MTTPAKVQLHLIATQTIVQIKESKVNVSGATPLFKVMELIRKKLTIPPAQSIFLYFREFALYPDNVVGDLVQYSPGLSEYDIYYSVSEAYG